MSFFASFLAELEQTIIQLLHPLSEADEVRRGVMAAGHCHSQ
jgi:hypothetical protein